MYKGLYKVVEIDNIPKGYAFHAKNSIISKTLDSATNEKGTTALSLLAQFNPSFISGKIIHLNYIIYIFQDTTGMDCIAVYNEDTNTIELKLQKNLGLHIDYPVSGVAEISVNNQLIVAFTNYYSPPKYVNLDDIDVDDSEEFYRLFPIFNATRDMKVSIQTGGSLPAGTYFISTRYIFRDGTKTDFNPLIGPIYITVDDNLGNKAGVTTNKNIKVTNLFGDFSSIGFDKIEVAVVSSIGGVIKAEVVKQLSASVTTSITYNGSEFLYTATLEEIITPSPVYDKVKHITSVNKQLYLADLTTPENQNLQSLANSLRIYWTSIYETDNTSDKKKLLYKKTNKGELKTLCHDEVYALYIQYVKDGKLTPAFHIPGKALVAEDRASVSLDGGNIKINNRLPYKYEIQDTCTFEGTETTEIDGLTFTTKYGRMGVWENEDEVYPDNFPDFNGQKVRHHRLPSLEFMRERWPVTGGLATDKSVYGVDGIDCLGVRVNLGVHNTPSSLKIQGYTAYRILAAKRDLSNVTVLGTSNLHFSGQAENQAAAIVNSTGNFNIKALDTSKDIIVKDSYIRFNCFDLWQDRPSLANTYIRNHFKILSKQATGGINVYADGTEQLYGVITHFAKDNFFGDKLNIPGVTTSSIETSSIAGNTKFKQTKNQKYIPNNTIVSTINNNFVDNRLSEETAHLELTTPDDYLDLDIGDYTLFTDTIIEEETLLTSLKILKNNLFLAYNDQTLITLSEFQSIGNNLSSFHGDCFVGAYSYASTTGQDAGSRLTPGDGGELKGVRSFKVVNTVGRHNPSQRYLVDGDYSSYFYPDAAVGAITATVHTLTRWQAVWKLDDVWNNFKYDKDYSLPNYLDNTSIFDLDAPNVTELPYRIQRSLSSNPETNLDSGWKSYKAGDYFETTKNKGRITNLVNWGEDILLIHHERALFRTRDKAVLQTDTLNVQLGSGDIFAIEPKEEHPTTYGYGGTQHKFGCLLCEAGYVYPDASTGEMFLYNGQFIHNISKGLKNDFQDYLKTFNVNGKDNPLNNYGISTAFDKENYRIIISLKGVQSFTVSYDILRGEKGDWASFHDFKPDNIFNTRNKLYSIKDKDVHVHNSGPRGTYYGTTYPFFVDLVVNDAPDKEKLLSAIYWISRYFNSQGLDITRTIDYITIRSNKYTTGRIPVITNTTKSIHEDRLCNAKMEGEKWAFNSIYNRLREGEYPNFGNLFNDYISDIGTLEQPYWSDSEQIRDKAFIIRLEFSNLLDHEIRLINLEPLMRLSNP